MNATWTPKNCPFCGKNEISTESVVLDHKMGQDCPCSTVRRVQAVCNYCGARGPLRTIDQVYDEEILAAAIEGWNKRSEMVITNNGTMNITM